MTQKWHHFALYTAFFFNLAHGAMAGVYNPKIFRLDNGLTCLLVENHRSPVATLMVYYKVGSIDEPRGKSGLAHYLEHLMFKGTPDSASGRYDIEMGRIGAEFNAQTGPDHTVYYGVFPSDKLPLVADLESKRMENLTILPEYATPELSVILEERLMRIKNNPSGEFIQSLYALFFRHNPVRLPVIGWEHEIKGYTVQDASDFHKRFYTPNNAVVVIAGDVTEKQAKTICNQYFAPIPARDVNRPPALIEPVVTNETVRLETKSVHVASPYYVRLYRTPFFDRTSSLKPLYALQILQNYLGENMTGLLEKKLIEHRRIASSISVSYDGISRNAEAFVIGGEPTSGHTVQDLEKAIDDELQVFLKKGLTESELAAVKKRMLAGLAFVKDDVLSGAQSLGRAAVCDFDLAEFDAWPDRIEAVTVRNVMDAAHLLFTQTYDFRGVLMPVQELKQPAKADDPTTLSMNRETH